MNLECSLNATEVTVLTLILLTWTIWRAPTNVSKWRMGFNSAFKGLKKDKKNENQRMFIYVCSENGGAKVFIYLWV